VIAAMIKSWSNLGLTSRKRPARGSVRGALPSSFARPVGPSSHQRRPSASSARWKPGRCHSDGTERRALSGLASPASTVLRIPLRGTRLRRAVDPGDLPAQRA
jgi:hypothetical protein